MQNIFESGLLVPFFSFNKRCTQRRPDRAISDGILFQKLIEELVEKSLLSHRGRVTKSFKHGRELSVRQPHRVIIKNMRSRTKLFITVVSELPRTVERNVFIQNSVLGKASFLCHRTEKNLSRGLLWGSVAVDHQRIIKLKC